MSDTAFPEDAGAAAAIALDVMGGDHAPEAQVEGAVLALRAGIGPVTLVGNAGEVEAELERQKVPPGTFTIVHAAETVAMDESPTYALKRKRDASIAVATRLVRDSKACALVSCGSTGAQVASSILHLGRLPGVERPAIAVAFPGTRGWGVLIDAGANAQNRPSHLVGFAVMGTLYLRHIFGVAEPRVGLVSIGEEAAKGNELVVEAHRLLGLTLGINFIGMVEGRGVYTGGADVLVCDGFVGNVLLKFSESASHWVVHHLREGMRGRPLVALGGLLMRPAFRYFRRKCSPSSIGGAPLLGVKGTSIIAHGSSDAEAVFNAIAMARRLVNERVNEKITANLRLEPPEER